MGVLYMLLSLAVMVPMAFLTESVVSRLSSELQTSASDVRDGIDRRRVNEALTTGFLQAVPDRNSCQELIDSGFREFLEGDAPLPSMDGEKSQQPVSQRYFFFPDEASPTSGSGFLLRLSQDSEFIQPLHTSSYICNSAYQPPALTNQPLDLSICRVEDASRLSRVNPHWQWAWQLNSPELPTKGDYSLCAQGLLISQKND